MELTDVPPDRAAAAAPPARIERDDLPGPATGGKGKGTGAVSSETAAAVSGATELPTGSAKKPKKSPCEPFALAGSLPMIPENLVEKILKGQYVDLSDLLQAKKSTGTSGSSATESGLTQRYKRREFTKDETSWIQCFTVYTAIVCSQDPGRHNDLLGYMVIMSNEGRRFKYQGWLTYDEMFRQSVVKSKSKVWYELNGTLYANTFLSQQKAECVTCQTCSSPDHHTSQCALTERKPAYRPPYPPRRKRPRSRSPDRGICYAWNDGKCSRGYSCKYKHAICLKCGGDHRAVQCIMYKKK